MGFRRPPSSRASALIVVLGVLLVLASIAVSFARMTSVERDAATARSDEVQARFVAWSGVERAMAELRLLSRRPWDGPDGFWFYRGLPGLSTGNSIALDEATAPSFLAGTTRYGRVYSGMLPQTYEPEGDTYVLKVVDCASMIDLNVPSDPRQPVENEPLVRMLANLSRAIDPSNPPITTSEAQMILGYRDSLPGGRFETKNQLLSIPGGPVTFQEFDRIAGFVTAHAWRDPSAVSPMDPALMPPQGQLVHGRIPTGVPVRRPRAPVDVNTAPIEVLIAVLADVTAFYVDPIVARTPAGSDTWRARGVSSRTIPVSIDQARALAQRILDRRAVSPLRHREEFEDLLAAAVSEGVVDRLQASAIVADVDSNIDSHRSNPDRVLWRSIDKFDLVVATTEFNFNSGGMFEIESIGRVTADGGKIAAESHIRTVVVVYDVYRETTQSQFESGASSTYDRVDDQVFRIDHGLLTGGSLLIDGNALLQGAAGSAHSNADLEVKASVHVEGDATASGGYTQGKQAKVDGDKGGGYPVDPIPTLTPTDYRAEADYVFGGDGNVYDSSGKLVGNGSFRGFSWQSQKGTWSANGPDTTPATYYFEGNVSIAGNTGKTTWKVTIIATGHVNVQGTPNYGPNSASGITILAGTDVEISGNPGARIDGMSYAGEQVQMSGNTVFNGPVIARDRSNSDPFVQANKIFGSVVLRYEGGLEIIGGEDRHSLKTVSNFPDPDAMIDVNGQPTPLSELNEIDGFIGLAPLQTGKSVLGAQPYRDRLLATWEGAAGLDADFGGGSLAMVLDSAGPVIAPYFGTVRPGNLLRDGIFSESDAVAAFESLDNVGSLQGTIAFWFKPAWSAAAGDAERTNRSHHLIALSRTDGGGGTQSFQLAHAGTWNGSWSDVFGFHFERTAVETDAAQRLIYSSSWTPPAHQWTHLAIAWDFTDTAAPRAISLFVNGVEIPGAIRDFVDPYDLTSAELARAAINAANLLRLGERTGSDYQLPAASSEGTYDELISLSVDKDAAWAAARYREGRYYSGPRAIYQSAALPIAPGADVLYAAWTVRYPPGWTGPRAALKLRDNAVEFASTDLPEGTTLDHRVERSIDYQIVFLDDRGHGSPLYETPVIDDLTIGLAREQRILIWEE